MTRFQSWNEKKRLLPDSKKGTGVSVSGIFIADHCFALEPLHSLRGTRSPAGTHPGGGRGRRPPPGHDGAGGPDPTAAADAANAPRRKRDDAMHSRDDAILPPMPAAGNGRGRAVLGICTIKDKV